MGLYLASMGKEFQFICGDRAAWPLRTGWGDRHFQKGYLSGFEWFVCNPDGGGESQGVS